MTHLQEQLDEFELLESVFSAPGEFEVEDRASHSQAAAHIQQLTPDIPKSLSCVLNIPINAHLDSEDDEENEASSSSVVQFVRISIRVTARSVCW